MMSARQSVSDVGTHTYDETYYRRSLHNHHWFRSNRRKHDARWRDVLRMVGPSKTDTVLDLGCAIGEHAFRLAPLVARVIALDSSSTAIQIARARGCDGVGNITFVCADVSDMSMLAEQSVDKVMAIDLVEHIHDETLHSMQREVWRVLRPGGTISIYTPNATHYVERLKADGRVLHQIPGHIAVRCSDDYLALFSALPWEIADSFFSPSTYPLFGLLDSALWRLPYFGPLFRFRYCLVLRKPGHA